MRNKKYFSESRVPMFGKALNELNYSKDWMGVKTRGVA
jgi:hypothetical protein